MQDCTTAQVNAETINDTGPAALQANPEPEVPTGKNQRPTLHGLAPTPDGSGEQNKKLFAEVVAKLPILRDVGEGKF